jgi:protein TonB
MNAQRVFKNGYRKRLDLGLCVALLAALALFGFTHPADPDRRDAAEETPLEIVTLQPELVIPPPPAAVSRPVIPEVALDEDFVDEELPDNTLDVNDLTPPPPAAPAGTFQVLDRSPRPRTVVEPEYPSIARDAGIEGRVTCRVTIDKDGRVTEVVIQHSDAEVFDRCVIAALLKWTWWPAEQSGNPVRASVVVPYQFRLDR